MTNRFKEDLIIAEKQGNHYMLSLAEVRDVIQLATEAEQLRKERDELAAGLIDIHDRTIQFGKTLYAGDAGQKALVLAKKVNENGNA